MGVRAHFGASPTDHSDASMPPKIPGSGAAPQLLVAPTVSERDTTGGLYNLPEGSGTLRQSLSARRNMDRKPMTDPTIVCPNCQNEIKLNGASIEDEMAISCIALIVRNACRFGRLTAR